MGNPQLSPQNPSSHINGLLAEDGGNDIMAQVQRAQHEAMAVAQESMRQNKQGLMDVKAALQSQKSAGRSSGRYL